MAIIFAIETSCDETSAAFIDSTAPINDRILSNVIRTQVTEHQAYGGVVPELAARAHLENILPVVQQAERIADIKLKDADYIAVTSGPGLIGGVIVGLMFAKSLALSLNKTLYAINHLEGHALSVRLNEDLPLPFLLLLVSGGHCQFINVEAVGKYTILGQTLDDAVGECFDKVAKMLGLDFPGGPALEKLAACGNPNAYDFPKPLWGKIEPNLSLSGLKTAVRLCIEKNSIAQAANIAASFQKTVTDILMERTQKAIAQCNKTERLVLAGGVAANTFIREAFMSKFLEQGINCTFPPASLCTDNAAMIGWAAAERIAAGRRPDPLTIRPLPHWPLNTLD